MADMNQNLSPFIEAGTTGLKRTGGYVWEEFLRELQGQRGALIYRQMADNDPVVGAIIFVIEQLCRQVSFRADPSGTDQADLEAADFLASNLNDMSHSWPDTLVEILSELVFGWSNHEIVYKKRQGDSRDPSMRSQYTDGRIGWRKLPIRAQESLDRWEFDENGGIQGMYQRGAPDYRERFIPIDKSLLFRPKQSKGNPEGRSILRSAYRPWYFKTRMEQLEGIGAERDLCGLPVAYVPPEILSKNAPAEMQESRRAIEALVQNIRRDEKEGVVFPMAYNERGDKMFSLELLSTGGSRQFDTNVIIQRFNSMIAMVTIADLILIGQTATGSYALMDAKVRLFEKALVGYLDSICEVFNRHAIPRLFALNNFPIKKLPTLAHGPVSSPNLKELAEYVNSLVGAGVIVTGELEAHLLRVADLPVPANLSGNEVG